MCARVPILTGATQEMYINHTRTRPARIVLAEDDRAFARLVEIALKRTGIPHELELVRDGEEAIAAVEKDVNVPDLLLLDLYMPAKTGFDVLEHVKRHDLLRRTPVVIFSNSDLTADVIKAYDLHANAYILKTADFADLCRTMETTLHFWLNTAAMPF
jgi:chemotaxis family two-component system response regulator Rcp1